MTPPAPPDDRYGGYFDSSDSQDLIVDGPGDRTVGPPSPGARRAGLAERERMARAGFPLPPLPEEQPPGEEAVPQ